MSLNLLTKVRSVVLIFATLLCGVVASLNATNSQASEQDRASSPEFIHPGIAHTQASIDHVKGMLEAGEQPWVDNWNRLNESRYARLNRSPEPRANVQRGASNNPDIGSSEFSRDSNAVYTHALHWALSGDERHAKKAAEILNAWSSTLETITNHDAKLLVGMEGHKFCNAAELLRHTWGGWPEAEQKQFRLMLTDVWHPIIKDFFPSANGNWDASMLQTMIAMGVFLDDRAMFDRAVHYYLEGEGNGAIGNYFNDFGECQESGRDQTHTQMGLEFLANTCETAWNQGVDLYSAQDNRLLLGFEYTAKYNLGYDVPYERYISFDGRYDYKSISTISRGYLRRMYEKVNNHYHNRKGLPTKYTSEAAMKPSGKKRRGVSLPWDELMYINNP